jgi:TonB family protein
MRLLTLLAVAVLRSGAPDAGAEQGTATPRVPEVEPGLGRSPVVDTAAVSPPLRVRHGSIDGDKVREVVSSHKGELGGCYERAVLENPHLSGMSTLRIVIDRDGTVGTASVQSSTLHSVTMQRCLLQLVRTWRFPPPADGSPAAVDYPLIFRKGEPDAGS